GIGVVYVVKTPENWHYVVGPMPPPVGVIHEQESGDYPDPARQRNPVQQSKMSIMRPTRDGQRHRKHQPTEHRVRRRREHEVPNKPAQRDKMLVSQWKTGLQPEQRKEHSGEQG